MVKKTGFSLAVLTGKLIKNNRYKGLEAQLTVNDRNYSELELQAVINSGRVKFSKTKKYINQSTAKNLRKLKRRYRKQIIENKRDVLEFIDNQISNDDIEIVDTQINKYWLAIAAAEQTEIYQKEFSETIALLLNVKQEINNQISLLTTSNKYKSQSGAVKNGIKGAQTSLIAQNNLKQAVIETIAYGFSLYQEAQSINEKKWQALIEECRKEYLVGFPDKQLYNFPDFKIPESEVVNNLLLADRDLYPALNKEVRLDV